jgi:TPR repeat protein
MRQAASCGDRQAEFAIDHSAAPMDFDVIQSIQNFADNGSPLAQYLLGSLYENARGLPQDYGKAKAWYVTAAVQGNTDAMRSIGALYIDGKLGKVDRAAGIDWFRRSSALGDLKSQVQLGELMADAATIGGSTPRAEIVEAYKWLALASKSGNATAGSRLDQITGLLSAAELKRARQAVSNWQASTPDPNANPSGSVRFEASAPESVDQEAVICSLDFVHVKLAQNGYNPGQIDFQMTDQMQSALKKFQADRGLSATGSIDDSTSRQVLNLK